MTIYPDIGPSVRYRIKIYRELFHENGIDLSIWSFMSKSFYIGRRNFGFIATLKKLLHMMVSTIRLIWAVPNVLRYDAVIIHREVFPIGPAYFEKLICFLNKNTFYDIDDAIWHPPSNEVNQRSLLWDSNRVADIMKSCKCVIAGNDYLKRYSDSYNSNVVVVPTPYYDIGCKDRYKKNDSVSDDIVIIWIGNIGNAAYCKQVIGALEMLKSTRPVILRLVGGEDIHDIKSDVLTIDYLLWNDIDEQGLLKEADIGIMPLSDDNYEKGKCGFKLIQYFSAGLPVVASPVGVNVKIVEQGVNGFLADSVEDWMHALTKLIEDIELRHRLGDNAYMKFNENYTVNINGLKILDSINNEVGILEN